MTSWADAQSPVSRGGGASPCRWRCGGARRRTRRRAAPCSSREVGAHVVAYVVGVEPAPGRRTTNALRRWPNSGSGTPMTAASTTSGCCAITSSTSAGNTFSPPETIMSSSRPSTNKRPSRVEVAGVAGVHEPVDDRLRAAVGVAVEQQAAAHEDAAGARPAATSRPSSSSSRTSMPRGGRPAVAGRGAEVVGVRDRHCADFGRAVEVVDARRRTRP